MHAGAKVPSGDGWYLPPTVLSGITADMPVAQEEIFGPVALVLRVPDLTAAIVAANETTFGLGSSVWCNDADEIARCIEEVEAGQVFVNDDGRVDARAPLRRDQAIRLRPRAVRARVEGVHQPEDGMDRLTPRGGSPDPMTDEITYLDHAATTALRPEVAAAMASVHERKLGNPTGSHPPAQRARALLEEARDEVAAFLGRDPGEIVFTSGGTEAANLAVLGPAGSRARCSRRGRRGGVGRRTPGGARIGQGGGPRGRRRP